MMEEAVELAQTLSAQNLGHHTVVSQVNYSTALTLYGIALNEEKRWSEAKSKLQKALKIRDKYLCENNLYTARTKAALGLAVYKLSENKEGASSGLFERALAALGLSKYRREKGISLFKSALDAVKNVDPQHHLASYIYLQYGQILFNSEKYSQASHYAQQAIACIEEACGSKIHPNVVEGHLLLYRTLKKLDEGDLDYHHQEIIFICDELSKKDPDYNSRWEEIKGAVGVNDGKC